MNIKETLRLHNLWQDGREGGVRADLGKIELRGVDLSWVNLRRIDLQGVDLLSADLKGAGLLRANFTSANLRHANFLAANLSGANFSHAKLGHANLSSANLLGAVFTGADIEKANMTGALLDCKYLIHEDLARNYKLYQLPCKEPMYVAGCRTFTRQEALAHWRSEESRQNAYVRAIMDN